jgi:hypothetical protein
VICLFLKAVLLFSMYRALLQKPHNASPERGIWWIEKMGQAFLYALLCGLQKNAILL